MGYNWYKLLSTLFFMSRTILSEVCVSHRNGLVGQRLRSELIGVIFETTWAVCVRECYQLTRCTGVKFRLSNNKCFFMHVAPGDVYSDDADFVSGTMDMWPAEIFGTCANRPCTWNEVCLPAEPNHVCIPWCDKPLSPPLVKGSWEGKRKIGAPAGSVMGKEHCVERYLPPPGGYAVTCQQNATWLMTSPWACREIRNCVDVKLCRHTYKDGVYSVIKDGVISAVTCTRMSSSSPTTDTHVESGASVQIPNC